MGILEFDASPFVVMVGRSACTATALDGIAVRPNDGA